MRLRSDAEHDLNHPWGFRATGASGPRSTHSYGFVLVLVLVAICVLAVAPEAHWAWMLFVLMQAAILQIALWTSGLVRAARRSSILLAVLVVVLGTAQLAWATSSSETAWRESSTP